MKLYEKTGPHGCGGDKGLFDSGRKLHGLRSG